MLTQLGDPAVQFCSKDYTKALLEWVDPECLPEYLGGTSKATLLDDVGPWQDPKILAQARALPHILLHLAAVGRQDAVLTISNKLQGPQVNQSPAHIARFLTLYPSCSGITRALAGHEDTLD